MAAQQEQASFVVCTDLHQGLTLGDFASGSADAPEFSCTLLVELPSLTDGPRLDWRGPGIQDVQEVSLQGLPPGFWGQWQANHDCFPQGVDLIFTCGDFTLGLPRTAGLPHHPAPFGLCAAAGHGAHRAGAPHLRDLQGSSLRADELGEPRTAPGQDEEFVLSHADNVEASGFVQHLKLPHYVDFQAELELVRKLRARHAQAAQEAA